MNRQRCGAGNVREGQGPVHIANRDRSPAVRRTVVVAAAVGWSAFGSSRSVVPVVPGLRR